MASQGDLSYELMLIKLKQSIQLIKYYKKVAKYRKDTEPDEESRLEFKNQYIGLLHALDVLALYFPELVIDHK